LIGRGQMVGLSFALQEKKGLIELLKLTLLVN
jgi:hypothetical protein